MSDLHATERIIGGLIVVGVTSLLSWNAAQGGDAGVLGMLFTAVMVLGGLWVAIGLFELFVGHPLRQHENPMSPSSTEPNPSSR